MLGMHGTVVANYAVDSADLLLAIGVRFDDRVTGKLEQFAARAKIVHIDIDPAEISKNKTAHIPVVAHSKPALQVAFPSQCSTASIKTCRLHRIKSFQHMLLGHLQEEDVAFRLLIRICLRMHCRGAALQRSCKT